jgi:hypothetical protein
LSSITSDSAPLFIIWSFSGMAVLSLSGIGFTERGQEILSSKILPRIGFKKDFLAFHFNIIICLVYLFINILTTAKIVTADTFKPWGEDLFTFIQPLLIIVIFFYFILIVVVFLKGLEPSPPSPPHVSDDLTVSRINALLKSS